MKNYITCLILGIIFSVGCTDNSLDISNPNELSDDSFWKSEGDAYSAVVGCYDALQAGDLYGGGPWSSGVISLEGLTDNAYWNWDNNLNEIARGIASPENEGVQNWWAANYRAIARCNKVIANVPNIEMDDNKSRRYIAEAKFIRALCYLNLSMTFRDVPLILEPQTLANADIAKSTKTQITQQIINDFTAAVADLPHEIPQNERGRASSGAALALLARTLLNNGQWNEAATAAKKVMTDYNYAIHPSYKELFSLDGENSREIIFAVEFERGVGEGQLIGRHFFTPPVYMGALPDLTDAYYCTDGLPIEESPLFMGDATQQPSLDNLDYMFNEDRYKNRDPRMAVTLVTNGSLWQEKLANTRYLRAGVAFRKWTEEQIGDNALDYSDNALNFQIIRYADVLLMWAEAVVMSGEYVEREVFDAINQIRQRPDVMMPRVEDVEGTDLSSEQLLNVIRHERRIELAYEALRYFDLVRWGEIKQVWNNVFVPSNNNRLFVEPQSNVWPIPLSEVENNDLLEQHSEWQ